jgi:hypothetical protein
MLDGLRPGDQLARVTLHARYGGSNQGGIAPSNASGAILFFTDPETGHQHGYYDGWGEDGLFHYVGAGQRGDQKLNGPNGSILKHREMGRTLEGFRGSRGVVTYLGEFELVDHYFTDAHETNDNTTMRQVVVFRLRPKDRLAVDLPRLPFTPEPHPVVEVVAVEEQHTEKAYVAPDREPYVAELGEAKLVGLYRDHLRTQGHEVSRLRIVPPGESRPLYSDLWVESTRELIEAKGTVSRDHLRQAVGQLLDYGRFADAKSHAILLPSRPRADLLAYLDFARVCVIYPEGGRWIRIESSH